MRGLLALLTLVLVIGSSLAGADAWARHRRHRHPAAVPAVESAAPASQAHHPGGGSNSK